MSEVDPTHLTNSIDADRRACLVAVHLSGAGRKELRWLYRGLDALAAPEARKRLGNQYGRVEVLTSDSLRSDSFIDAIAELCGHDDVDAVDLILIVHGSERGLTFSQQDRVDSATLGARIAAVPGAEKLRFVYSLACYGSRHAPAFLAAGFDTAVGAKLQNTNGASEYRRLLDAWAGGATVDDAVASSDRRVPRMFWDLMARVLGGMRSVDSSKVVTGRRSLRISDAPGQGGGS